MHEGALGSIRQLWERSVERHGFRYTTIVSNEDAKAFKHLCDRRVYGNVELKKEECINHVAKRLGTALRKLRASSKKVGVVIGGRGHGTLTPAAIDKLEGFYSKAVRGYPQQPGCHARCCVGHVLPCNVDGREPKARPLPGRS